VLEPLAGMSDSFAAGRDKRKYFSVILGTATLLSMTLFATTSQFNYLGLDFGRMKE
jgi:hypothetical protein